HDHWKREANLAIFPTQRLNVAKANVRLVAGHEISDGRREDVRPLLFYKRSPLPFRLRCFIDALCFFALANYAVNDAIADANLQVVTGSVMGKRENITRLDRLGARVDIPLRDRR